MSTKDHGFPTGLVTAIAIIAVTLALLRWDVWAPNIFSSAEVPTPAKTVEKKTEQWRSNENGITDAKNLIYSHE